MAKPIDPKIAEVLRAYGFGRDAAWDCHGTWVVYHRVLEQIAAKAGIRFDMPVTLEANGAAKTAAICVAGTLGEKSEWSIGESSPANNKNAYPYAMAEKRAKDRVVLKLIGLHGLAYSEDEADDFKAPVQATQANVEAAPDPVAEARKAYARLKDQIGQVATVRALDTLMTGAAKTLEDMPEVGRSELMDLASKRREEMEKAA